MSNLPLPTNPRIPLVSAPFITEEKIETPQPIRPIVAIKPNVNSWVPVPTSAPIFPPNFINNCCTLNTKGNLLLQGQGAPLASMGDLGDLYLDTVLTNNEITFYVKTNSGWQLTSGIAGFKFGNSLFQGSGVPNVDFGYVGDLYTDWSNLPEIQIYRKTINGWELPTTDLNAIVRPPTPTYTPGWGTPSTSQLLMFAGPPSSSPYATLTMSGVGSGASGGLPYPGSFYYFDANAEKLYGPTTYNTLPWPSTPLSGKLVESASPPTINDGDLGDYYYDFTADKLYGPKHDLIVGGAPPTGAPGWRLIDVCVSGIDKKMYIYGTEPF